MNKTTTTTYDNMIEACPVLSQFFSLADSEPDSESDSDEPESEPDEPDSELDSEEL